MCTVHIYLCTYTVNLKGHKNSELLLCSENLEKRCVHINRNVDEMSMINIHVTCIRPYKKAHCQKNKFHMVSQFSKHMIFTVLLNCIKNNISYKINKL